MPLRAVCPECGATTTLDDDSTRRTVECEQCGKLIAVQGAKAPAPPPLPNAEGSGGDAGFEVLDDEEPAASTVPAFRPPADDEEDERPPVRRRDDDEDDRPRRTRLASDDDEDGDRPRRTRLASNDDEDEDERPSARARRDRENDEEEKSPRPRAGRSDDDDDEEETSSARPSVGRYTDDEDEKEEEPRTRRAAVGELDDEDEDGHSIPRRKQGGGYPGSKGGGRARAKSGKSGLIVMVLLAFVLLGAGGGAAAYFFWPKDPVTVVDDNQPKPPPEEDPNKVDPNPPDPKLPGPPKELRVPKPNELALVPVNLPDGKKTIPLPGKVSDICAGADGRFLFLHCPEQRKLVVYDICQAGIVTELPTTGNDSRIAAGMSKLFIANNATRKIERFDLAKLEKDKEGPYPFAGTIQSLSLGHSSTWPALVMGTLPKDGWPLHFLDQETLGLADMGYVGWTKPEAAESARDLQFRAAAQGNAWVGLSPKSDAKDLYFLSRNGKALTARKHECSGPPGYAALSADGRMVFSRFGKATANQVEDREPDADPEKFVVPALNGEFHLWIEKVMGRERNAQVGTFQTANFLNETLSEIPQPYRPGAAMSPDRHAFYSPEAQCLLIVPPEAERIEARHLDPLKNASTENIFVTSNQNLTFTPGKPVNHKFRVMTNSKEVAFKLVDGETTKSMKGLSLSPAGELKWDAPVDEAREIISIQVEVAGKMRKDLYFIVFHNSKAVAPSKIEPKKSPEPKAPTVGIPPHVAPGAKLVQEPPGRLPITAPEMKDPHAEIALPGPIRDACVGGGGRYIIFHCPTVRKLAIFDVTTLKVEKTITLATDEILFAAGMEKLLVIYPDEKQVHRYSLASYKLEDDLALEVRQRPTAAAMGSATAGPLVLGGIPAQNNASKMVLSFLDLVTLKEVWIEKAEGDFKVGFGAAAHMRASADGRTLGAWLTQLRPSGLQVARLAGNTISGSYVAESVGHVTPGPDGQTVFTEKGMFTTKGEQTGRREAAVPGVHGNWFLTLAPNAKGPADAQIVRVWEMGKETAIQEFDDVPGFNGKRDPFERDNPTLALDRKFYLVPEAKVLIVLPPAANKLHAYRIEPMKK